MSKETTNRLKEYIDRRAIEIAKKIVKREITELRKELYQVIIESKSKNNSSYQSVDRSISDWGNNSEYLSPSDRVTLESDIVSSLEDRAFNLFEEKKNRSPKNSDKERSPIFDVVKEGINPSSIDPYTKKVLDVMNNKNYADIVKRSYEKKPL